MSAKKREGGGEVARQQLDVCTVPLRGLHLIEASAGTGKTYTITSLVLRLIVEEELPIESILAVTFTNAATAELKERVVNRVLEARRVLAGQRGAEGDPVFEHLLALPEQKRVSRLLENAARDADRAAVFTIHGFAARMLRDHAFESGAREDAELIGDQRAIVQDVVTDFWTSRIATLPEADFLRVGGASFYRQLTRVGLQAAAAFEVPLVSLDPPLDVAEKETALAEIFERARRQFAAQGEELLQLLVSSPALNRNKMKVASLQADYALYCAYFASGMPGSEHPKSERFTQSKVLDSGKAKLAPPEHELLVTLEELRDARLAVDRASADFSDGLRAELCRLVAQAVHEEHERAGTQSFDGLLADLCHALRDADTGEHLASAIRTLLPVALIDEFQDTDPTQYEIFQRIYGSTAQSSPTQAGALYLIGDPKQSIYAFRGADVFTYLKAARQATGGVWTLATSYRASPRLVAAQNALFEKSPDPFGVAGIVYDRISVRPGGEDLLLDREGQPLPGLSLIDTSEEPENSWLVLCAEEIAHFLAAGHQLKGRAVKASDIAVLSRTNRQAQELQAELRKIGIPAVMHGDRSVLESDEAVELRRVLLALAEPGHRSLSRTALASRLLGLQALDLEQLDSDLETLEEWTGKLRLWGELWRDRGVAHALESMAAGVELTARTLADRDGERRMTNFRHLFELLHEAESSEHLGVAGLLRWLEGAISDPLGHAMAAEARQLRLESDEEAITLTTAHKSKGLEYGIVFLPTISQADTVFSEEAYRFHDPERAQSLFEMRGKATRGESDEIHKNEAHQESLRLGYVALTRAKHQVVVLCGANKKFSSLAYLLHESGGVEGAHERLKKLKPLERERDILEVVSQSEGSLELRPLSAARTPYYERPWGKLQLEEPAALPRLAERERTSSFSAMTRGAHGSLSRAAREGHDIDEGTGGEELSLAPKEEPAMTRCALADFPRGARPGDALHAMFEFSPFAEGSAEQRQLVVERELAKRGFEGDDIQGAQKGLEEALMARIELVESNRSMSLGELTPTQRRPEMEFSLPVGHGEARLSAARLARALGYIEAEANAPEEARPPADLGEDASYLSDPYVARVAELPFNAWSGFLRGFIDLVYEWEGRLFVVDYKSNYLGEHYEEYTRPAMQVAMEEHHYLLQALLYSVAIHRYGQARIPGYSYDKHFGGVQYLFLRGLSPQHRGSGVYDFRPSESLIVGISQLLGEGAGV